MIKHVTVDCSDIRSMSAHYSRFDKDERGQIDNEIIDDGGVLYLNAKSGGFYNLKLVFPSAKDVDFFISTLNAFRDILITHKLLS